jgi:hypothetical protein
MSASAFQLMKVPRLGLEANAAKGRRSNGLRKSVCCTWHEIRHGWRTRHSSAAPELRLA